MEPLRTASETAQFKASELLNPYNAGIKPLRATLTDEIF
jgi:hypothetical protein